MMYPCRCCKTPLPPPRRVCPLCVVCDGIHGQQKHTAVIHQVRSHGLDPYHALTMMLVDDAWLCGLCAIDKDGLLEILRAPKRWEVVLAWARYAGVAPDLHAVLDAALMPYMHLRGTADVVLAAELDLKAAIMRFDPSLTDIEMITEPEYVDGKITDGVIFKVNVKAPISTSAETVHDAGAALPSDVMSRPRGQA